jgi:hypothetical protein
MKRFNAVLTAAAFAGALAGCGADLDSADTVGATFALSQASTSALGASILGVSPGDDSVRFGGQRIRLSAIDSLVVIVTRVDVLPDSEIHRCHPPVGDSVHGFRPGDNIDGPRPPAEGGPGGMMGPGRGRGPHGCHPRGPRGPHDHPPRPDSLVPPDSGWGSMQRHWYSLTVVGSGKLDLLALPTDSTSGLVLASGSLPVGEYGAARLIVSSAKIWFDTTITTSAGFTFQPNTAYDVKLPMRRDSIMGIMTNAGFTLSTGGADVVLGFDPNTTIGGAGVNAAGEIVIRPVLKPRRR